MFGVHCFLPVVPQSESRNTRFILHKITHISNFYTNVFPRRKTQLICGSIICTSSAIMDRGLGGWRDDFSRNISCIPLLQRHCGLFFYVFSCQLWIRSIIFGSWRFLIFLLSEELLC